MHPPCQTVGSEIHSFSGLLGGLYLFKTKIDCYTVHLMFIFDETGLPSKEGTKDWKL